MLGVLISISYNFKMSRNRKVYLLENEDVMRAAFVPFEGRWEVITPRQQLPELELDK